jgi:uncharacterized protein (DUF1501 family)
MTLSRRNFLRGGATLTALAAAHHALPAWMPKLAFAQPYDQPTGDILVSVFLRGGADMLNMIVPHGEEAYYAARPRLAIPRPDAAGSDPKVLDIDGFFGLHPALAPLLPLFQSGAMAAVHATGSPHDTRSHFEAMDFMERGTPNEYTLASGWIGRHLATLQNGNPSPVRAIGWGVAVQASLRGTVSPIAMQSIADYHLSGDAATAARMMNSLNSLYALEGEAIQASAQATLAALDTVAGVGYQSYQPRNGADYPESDFARALRQTAAIIRAEVGLEAACIDLGGWDTHVNQGGVEGQHARLMTELSEGLAAFHADMDADMRRVTVVVMSEFGRQVRENGGGGTDHGHGSALLTLSGNLATSGVLARWTGLASETLDQGDALPITIDYRDILSELLMLRLGNTAISEVFPDYVPTLPGLFRA